MKYIIFITYRKDDSVKQGLFYSFKDSDVVVTTMFLKAKSFYSFSQALDTLHKIVAFKMDKYVKIRIIAMFGNQSAIAYTKERVKELCE